MLAQSRGARFARNHIKTQATLVQGKLADAFRFIFIYILVKCLLWGRKEKSINHVNQPVQNLIPQYINRNIVQQELGVL